MGAANEPGRLLPVRRIRFEYPDDLDPAWAPHLPELAAAANAVSLCMPYAEPLFVRAVRSTYERLDEAQRDVAETYCRQETGHHAQHRRFNEIVTARYPATARLQRWIARCAEWVWRRGPRFAVAYAAGGETISFGVARWTDRNVGRFTDGADPVAASLFLWHLAEEAEHKSATYDVFEAVDGSRVRYAAAMLTGLACLGTFVAVGTLQQLWADRRLHRPLTWIRLVALTASLAATLLPLMATSVARGHHPSQFADPVYLPAWLRQFDPETGTIPVWHAPR